MDRTIPKYHLLKYLFTQCKKMEHDELYNSCAHYIKIRDPHDGYPCQPSF